MTEPSQRMASRWWRYRNSVWLLPTLAFGVLTWASFLYIATKSGRRAWKRATIGWTLGAIAVVALLVTVNDGDRTKSSLGDSFTGLTFLGMWIGGFVHAVTANRRWLRWRSRQSAEAWYQGAQTAFDDARPAPGPGASRPLPPPLPARTTPAVADDVFTGRAVVTSGPVPSTIDLNTSTLEQLVGLGLTPDVVARITETRDRLRGFSHPEQLMFEAGVAPHICAGLRGRVTASAPADQTSARGRRIDF
ncbi:hypothetical protein BH24ACT5_BH24ACT5_14380 [soil metagenome]